MYFAVQQTSLGRDHSERMGGYRRNDVARLLIHFSTSQIADSLIPSFTAVEDDMEDPFSGFTPSRKLTITSITGLGVLVVAIGMQCLLSALPQIAEDLGTTQEIVNSCLAGYNVMLGCECLLHFFTS